MQIHCLYSLSAVDDREVQYVYFELLLKISIFISNNQQSYGASIRRATEA